MVKKEKTDESWKVNMMSCGTFFFFKMAETKLLRWIGKIQESKRWETEDIRKRKEQFIEQVS